MSAHNTFVRRLGGVAAAALLALGLPAQASQFSSLVVFGDSLADSGRVYALTGGASPPAPYYQGRFSNGPVGVEYLASNLGIGISNYAYGGATTGLGNSNAGLNAIMNTGVLAQVAQFQAANSGVADPGALYFVMGGPNDFFLLPAGASAAQAQATAVTAVTNLVNAVGSLYAMGARNFLLPTMPDLGATASGAADDAVMPGAAAAATMLSLSFNAALVQAYEQLAGVLTGETFYVLDSVAVQYAALAQSTVGTASTCLNDLAFPACTGYMYFDGVHPTTETHRLFAQAFATAVPEPSAWMLGGVALLAAGLATRRRPRG